QRLQQCQQPGALLSKGLERWLEILFWIICLPDPRAGINGLERGVVLLENHSNAIPPDVSTGAQVGKHIVYRPRIRLWSLVQLCRFQSICIFGDARWSYSKQL